MPGYPGVLQQRRLRGGRDDGGGNGAYCMRFIVATKVQQSSGL
ncbi:MAG: hypothetical protein ABJO88_00155 [Parasphingorhabdus sp.]